MWARKAGWAGALAVAVVLAGGAPASATDPVDLGANHIVDESGVLLRVYGAGERFRDPVSTAMVSKLDILDVKSPVESLLPVFDRGHVAIVVDGPRFLGLITRIDLLNWLRRRVH